MRIQLLATAFAVFLACSASVRAEFIATTTSIAEARIGSLPSDEVLERIPEGREITVIDCAVDLCLVSLPSGRAWVAGASLSVGGLDIETHMKKVRAAKWAAQSTTSAIEVWGDSLSTNTYGDELSRLLNGRQVRMNGVPGENGSQILARMTGGSVCYNCLTILWDRHSSFEEPEAYMKAMSQLVGAASDRFLIISDIRSLGGTDTMSEAEDSSITEAINAALIAAYPNQFVDVREVLEDPKTRTDGLHLTQTGIDAVALVLADFIRANEL